MKYPRVSDIEFYAETAPRPPVLTLNDPTPVDEPSPVNDPTPVDDPSPKAPDVETFATSTAPDVVDPARDINETETSS